MNGCSSPLETADHLDLRQRAHLFHTRPKKDCSSRERAAVRAKPYDSRLDATRSLDLTPRGATNGMDADEVMRRYANGDAAAFDELYAALSPRLYPFCVRLVGRQGDADDLFQKTAIDLCNNLQVARHNQFQ